MGLESENEKDRKFEIESGKERERVCVRMERVCVRERDVES